MNNIFSTALVILTVLWLVRDVHTLDTKRRPGKSDFFFDDTTTPLASPTQNLANSFPFQSIIQPGWPQNNPDKSEDDKKPQSSPFPGGIGSLADMWKLLQQVVSILNPLASSVAKSPTDEDDAKSEKKLSPKVNLTGTTSSYGDIDLDEPFETTIEYASGNDSVDDEDYELNMNFSSPNPQAVFTSQTLDGSSYITPKSSNEDITEQSNIDQSFTNDPIMATTVKTDSNGSESPDVAEQMEDDLSNEFIDDYINKPPNEDSDENDNTPTPPSENNETEPEISNQNPPNENDETSTNNTEAPISPESKNGTSEPSLQNQIEGDVPSEDSDCTPTTNPEEDLTETSEIDNVSPTEDNPLQSVAMYTITLYSTDPDLKPDDDTEKSSSAPLQENTAAPVQKSVDDNEKSSTSSPQGNTTPIVQKPNNNEGESSSAALQENTTPVSPVQKPLKRPNLKKKPKTRNKNQKSKAPIDKQEDLEQASTTPSPQENSNSLKTPSPPIKVQSPQPKKSPNQISFQKPSFLINPNNPLIANLTPPEMPKQQSPLNKRDSSEKQPKPLIPLQNQTNAQQSPTAENKQPFSKPKVPMPQNQLNKTEPSKNQPNDTKPVTPQNVISTEQTPLGNKPQNTSLLTTEDKNSFAIFLNQFPRIKALLPQIANIPLLKHILGDAVLENCTDTDGLLPQNDLTTEGPAQKEESMQKTELPITVKPTVLPTTVLPTTVMPKSYNDGKTTPKSVTTASSVLESTKTTTKSPPAIVTPEVAAEELNPYDSDSDSDQEPSSDQENYDTEDNADDSEDNGDDTGDEEDDTEDHGDDTDGEESDTDDNTDADTEDDDEYNEEIDDLSVFDDSQEATTTVPSTTTTEVPSISTPSVFDKVNCTGSPPKAKSADPLKPPKKFNSILEYLYDNSKNPLFESIRKQQNKTMS